MSKFKISKILNRDEIDDKITEVTKNLDENYNLDDLLTLVALYNRKGMYNNVIEIIDNMNPSKVDLRFMSQYLKSYIYLNDYEKAIRILDSMSDIARARSKMGFDEDRKLSMIDKVTMLCLDRLDLLDSKYVAEFRENDHYLRQLKHYDHDYIVSFLEYTRTVYQKHNKFGFRNDLDLDLLVTELEDALKNAKKLVGTSSFDDMCYFYYPNANNYMDRTVTLIAVALIKDTNKILTVFPCSSTIDESYINYYDFKSNRLGIEENKKLTKSMSQIEKFNKKYNL